MKFFGIWKRIRQLCREWAFDRIWESEEQSISSFADVAILFFRLHILECEKRFQLLSEVEAKAPYILIADYRRPERNLDYIAFSLTGFWEYLGPHPQQYCHFMQKGGIEGFLCASSLIPVYRETCLGGAATLILCQKLFFGTGNIPLKNASKKYLSSK